MAKAVYNGSLAANLVIEFLLKIFEKLLNSTSDLFALN